MTGTPNGLRVNWAMDSQVVAEKMRICVQHHNTEAIVQLVQVWVTIPSLSKAYDGKARA